MKVAFATGTLRIARAAALKTTFWGVTWVTVLLRAFTSSHSF